jgi:hypothetical protein
VTDRMTSDLPTPVCCCSEFLSRVENEHNGVTADTIEGKVGHRECRLAANDCIECIAARLPKSPQL